MNDPTVLHVTNGESAAGSLRMAGLEGDVSTWADVLHEGPVPAGLDAREMLERRARYIASCGYATFDEAVAAWRRWDERIEEAVRAGARIVLWFEHDLFDQLILVRLLDRFGWGLPGRAASLICISRFPGVDPFYGLGQLTAAQLASLYPSRQPVSGAQAALASRAWKAFTASDPTELTAFGEADTSPLPFLATALRRLLEEYPSLENGLGRTERTTLEILLRTRSGEPRREPGGKTGRKLFRAQLATERAPFLGDTAFFAMLRRLSAGVHPLLALHPGDAGGPSEELEAVGQARVTLTPFGRQVLAGQADAVRLRGIDRWIGGVHLAGTESLWRWDGARRTLIRG